MSQIDDIKSRIDIVDLIGETVKLRRTGKNYSGLCPFHNEKTPRSSSRLTGRLGAVSDSATRAAISSVS